MILEDDTSKIQADNDRSECFYEFYLHNRNRTGKYLELLLLTKRASKTFIYFH
jgi:hypothetical protein